AWDRKPWLAFVGFVAASAVPFVVGIPYMALILNGVMGLELSVWQLLQAGLFPFVIGGVVKAAIAAAVIPGAWALVRRVDTSRD
ncbi:MAG TPA: biotin transporter BioY, partial [Microbacterium sp.]|nr:biotin transporter BioY [Microbacterium sp.]